MTKSLIASIVALSFVASVAASAIAHPQPQTSVQKPFPPKDFWDRRPASRSLSLQKTSGINSGSMGNSGHRHSVLLHIGPSIAWPNGT